MSLFYVTSISSPSTFGPCIMVCYCLAQRGGYIHLLTPFLPPGSALTHSNRSYCLPNKAQRAQQHCSHRSPPPTAGSHPVCTPTIHSVSSLHHTFFSHTAESLFSTLQLKTPLVLDGQLAKKCREGSFFQCHHGRLLPALQGHSPTKNHRAGNRVCLSEPSLSH